MQIQLNFNPALWIPPSHAQIISQHPEHYSRAIEATLLNLRPTGSPLMLTANVYWKRFLNVLCPAYTPPTIYALSTNLLDGEFNRVQAKVKQTIDKADCIAVISDGWSNAWGQGIINYIVSTPRPVFYKSTDTKDNRHTGPYIADELKAVINDLGPEKVFALTDNAANMKAAWAKVGIGNTFYSTFMFFVVQ